MDIREYLTILWRRKWVILCTFIVTEAIVIFFTIRATPIYTASAMLRIATYTTSTVNSLDYSYANRLKNTYVILATTKPVLNELKQRLGLTNLPDIGVTLVGDTELLQIKVQYPDPILAAKIVNTLSDILVSQSLELYTGGGESSLAILKEQLQGMEDELNQAQKAYTDLVAKNPSDIDVIQVAKQSYDLKQEIYGQMLDRYETARVNSALREKSIYVVDPATPPISPSNPNVKLNIALGSMVGLLGGAGLIFLFESLDTTLYSTEQIEKVTKLALLGTVPNADVRAPLISMDGNNAYIDAFRRLRSKLILLNQATPYHTLLVTSPEPGEGKSTLVTNLAYVLAQAGRKVAVIDCDLRRPTLHKTFELPNDQGLSNILNNDDHLVEVLQDCTIPGVKILTSGPIPSNPAELIGSQDMNSLINRLHQNFDHVLVDSPAMLRVSDAFLLATVVDGVILVVSRSYSHKEAVRSACKQLADVNAHVLGVVVNRAEKNRGYYYKHQDKKGVRKGIAAIFRR